MKKLLLACLMSMPLAVNAGDGSKVRYQMETRFGLTESAYRAISARVPLEKTDRTDYYADIYDGSAFLLPSSDNSKFRMKVHENKWVAQANTKLSTEARKCAEGWAFDVKEKRLGELKLSKARGEYFAATVKEQLDMLSGNAPDRVAKSVRTFQQFLLELPVPLMDRLLSVTANKRWAFTASHLSRKVKWKGPLPGNENIEVSLTQADDYVGSTFMQKRYEVEFQFAEEGLMSVNEFSEAVCSFMRGQGVATGDINPGGEVDVQQETLKRLAPFKDAILK
jgi:hypothetical protein